MRTVTLNSGPAVGADGVATANATSNHRVCGRVMAVGIKYNLTPPATCDVTVATTGGNHPAITILTISDAVADGIWRPRHLVHGETGAALTGTAGGDREPPYIDDLVKVTIAQANAGDNVDVWLLME